MRTKFNNISRKNELSEELDDIHYFKKYYSGMNIIKTFVAGEAFGEISLITK